MKILLGAGVGSFSWIPAVYLFLYDCVPKVATINTHKFIQYTEYKYFMPSIQSTYCVFAMLL